MLNFGVIRQSCRMSVTNIRSNKMRSFLTMLGIMIGVAAVIALITIIKGVTDSVMNRFSGLGADTLTISAPGTSMKTGLTDNDIALLGEVEGVSGISPTVSLMTTAVFDGTAYDKVSVEGHNTDYFRHNDILQNGRVFSEADMTGNSMVCIVDGNFVKNILLGKQVLGAKIRLRGYEYTVIGIRKESDSVMSQYTDRSDQDGAVIIPYRNALNMAGSSNVTSLEVYVDSAYDNADVEKMLRSELDQIYNNADNAYTIINMESLLSMIDQVRTLMSAMMGGIASIALLVGGIGIMNMMLVSVSERTKEIGLRKALGAEPLRIQAQFLIESIVLSVFGGLIGIVLGIFIAYIASIIMKTVFSLSMPAIALGLGFSIGVGVIFGWAPAKRASELNPIDALRSE
ncbi:MAG: ABC transporter permease [Lachnospiraceae bacterium]|jgi:putative ABC transport system permease protein|nr:ABC transporter permease [Lachnospiraceae bacterium]